MVSIRLCSLMLGSKFYVCLFNYFHVSLLFFRKLPLVVIRVSIWFCCLSFGLRVVATLWRLLAVLVAVLVAVIFVGLIFVVHAASVTATRRLLVVDFVSLIGVTLAIVCHVKRLLLLQGLILLIYLSHHFIEQTCKLLGILLLVLHKLLEDFLSPLLLYFKLWHIHKTVYYRFE